jgi:hypothetical protein
MAPKSRQPSPPPPPPQSQSPLTHYIQLFCISINICSPWSWHLINKICLAFNKLLLLLWLCNPLLSLDRFFSSFLILYAVGRTPWTGDQPAARPLPTHTTTQTNRINAHRHSCLEWDSNPRSSCSSERRQFMPQTARPLWSAPYTSSYWNSPGRLTVLKSNFGCSICLSGRTQTLEVSSLVS